MEAANGMLYRLLWQGLLSWYIATENCCLIVAFVLYRPSPLKSSHGEPGQSSSVYHGVSLGAINI